MTLLEVIVGLALALLLLGAMAWFVSDLVDTRDRLAAATARDGAATAFLERLESDLAFAITADASGSGVRGDDIGLSILTRGVILAGAAAGHSSQLGDLQRQEYRFDPQRQALVAQRSAVAAGAPRGTGPGGGSHTMLDGHLERVRFRYHDGRAWQERFDSRSDGGLPTLVEVSLWWAPRRNDDMAEDDLDPDLEWDEPVEDEFADFWDDDAIGIESRSATREAFRTPDRIRVIRIPDARPTDPDQVLPDDSALGPVEDAP